MYAQGSYNSRTGQGPPAAGLPPYQKLPLPPPPRPSPNFQENSQMPLLPGQPGMPLLRPALLQAPQLRRPYLPAPPARGSFMPPRMYNPSQQNYNLAPGILASRPGPPALSNSLDAANAPLPAKGLLPAPSPGKMMYGAAVNQLPLQAPSNISSRPLLPPNFLSGNPQISSVAPRPPSFSLPKPEEANTVKKIDENSSVQNRVTTGSNSASDSDMEMEDDITQPDNDHAINHSIEGQNNIDEVVSNEFDVKGQLSAEQKSANSLALLVGLPDKVSVTEYSGSGVQGTSGRETSELCCQVTFAAEAAECPSANNNKNVTNAACDNENSQRTLSAADGINSFGQVIESGNLIEHNQNQVSDKINDADMEQACPQMKSALFMGCAESLIKSTETSSGSERVQKKERDLAEESERIVAQGTLESLSDTPRVVKKAVSTSITSGSTESSNDKDHTSGCATSPKELPEENAVGGESVNVASIGKSQKEENDESAVTLIAQRIDEYGRLVREGVTDSDSDDSRLGRRYRKRRSRSRSRSPVDRRSPRRRRAKRSRSRSWSPVYRRSRSRSPSFRHVGKFSSGNMRRDKSQLSDCFDFLRGRCYRGASCRYRHHDSEKIDGSTRRNRGKHHVPSKNPNTQEDIKKVPVKVSDYEIGQKMQLSNNIPASSILDKEKFGDYAVHIQEGKEPDQPLLVDIPTPIGDTAVPKLPVEASQYTVPYLKDSVIQQSELGNSNTVVGDASHGMQQAKGSFVSDSLQGKISVSSENNLPGSETVPTLATSVHNIPYRFTSYPALSSELSTPSATRPSRDYGLKPEVAVQPHSLPGQNSGFSVPPNNASSLLPPKTPSSPPDNSGTTTHAAPLQFQQIPLPPKNDTGSHLRPYSAVLGGPSQVVISQHHAYSQIQHNFSQVQNYHQPATFSGNSLPSGGVLNSSSQFHPHLQQQQPPLGFGSAGISSSSRYLMDGLGLNQPAQAAQHNPYELPFGSNVSADVFRQEKNKECSGKNDHSLGGGFGSLGSVNPTGVTGQNVPRSGGDQYDPLLDSIEQPPNLSVKPDQIQKWEPSKDSEKVLRDECGGSNKPLDVGENNQNEESSVGVAVTTSADNEEIGETADEEVGNVEYVSRCNDNAVDNVDDGEMETDQARSSGKNKTSKESRSMRLFKVAIADFVKDVLKPSWRQGNMSKEAFKTVVKKTVDKVSAAMKNRQIPKSKAKIDQYINSSQRKLTKLVMGYVDKYAKG